MQTNHSYDMQNDMQTNHKHASLLDLFSLFEIAEFTFSSHGHGNSDSKGIWS